MTPRATRDLTPFIYEIGWRKFQRLSNELFSYEPEISKSDEYGIPGQHQNGIDLLALVRPTGIEVAQCKCESSFSVRKIRKAADEFFKYWPHWKDQNIRRFILIVACEVDRTELQDELLRQRTRFGTFGISYEIWGATTIRNKLRPHRTIATNYLDSEEIVNAICGPPVESASAAAGISLVAHRLGIFATELEEMRGEELESLRELSRAGEQSKALEGIKKLKEAATWSDHTATFRARVLRFEAAVQLNLRLDTDRAARLVGEAKELAPTADFQTIDSYLAYCRHDIQGALDHVERPASGEARNLRWNLLLESGNLASLAGETREFHFPADAETHRILTLFALAQADLGRAQVEIAKAMELGGSRRNIRLAKATVDYFSALSPAAEGMKRLSWAVPVSWAFVKTDSASTAALLAAEKRFAECAAHPDCQPAERENIQVWRLACLSCIDTLQAEANTLVQELLETNPASYGALAWALHRGYAFDRTSVEAGLRARTKQEPEDINVWLALWTLVWRDGDLQSGEAVVDEAEQIFRSTGNTDIWLFHKVQFVAHKNQDLGKDIAQQITDPELRASAEIAALRVIAGALKDRKAFSETLAAEVSITGNARRLFECCELKLRLNDFAFIAEHARRLVELIRTASALRLALEGAFRHGDYALCLSLLQDHKQLFREGALSPDVRHLKAICQHQLGDWSEALEEAAQIYHEQPNIGTFSAYFDLLARSGDIRRCAALARDLLKLKNAKPVHWLRAASVTRLHDPTLAKELWRAANRRPIKNLTLAGVSLQLAFALGVSDEANKLFKRLRKLARQGKGPLREQSIDETMAIFQARRESADKVAQQYLEGNVPVHLVAEQMNWPLALGYHAQIEANRAQTNLLHTPILFARSGARSLDKITAKSMLVDITALLLASDLGILDKVEEAFSPVYISPHSVESLAEQVTRLHPPQPERQEARKKMLGLISDGRVAVVDPIANLTIVTPQLQQQLGSEHGSLLEHAAKEGGVVLHDGPFLAEGSPSSAVELPPHAMAYVVPLNRLYDSLRDVAVEGATTLAEGASVLLPHSIIASLPADKIEAIAKRFRLMLIATTVNELQAEIDAYEKSIDLAKWTQDLLDRLQHGLTTGKYRIVRTARPSRPKLHENENPVTKALHDLLLAEDLPDGVTWCDDRMLTSHLRAGTRMLIGISEVLQSLKQKDAISIEAYFDSFLRLRESNVRYLPLVDGELEFHLKQAPTKDGHITETRALSILRRYINACMLDRSKLQGPLVDSNGNMQVREYEFPMGLRRSIDVALQATWKDVDNDLAVRTARADWLLENVYFDLLGIRQAFAKPTRPGEVRDLISGSIGVLYGEGIGLEFRTSDEPGLPPRQAFFDWLTTRLLDPLSKVDATLVGLVAKVVGNFVVSNSNDKSFPSKPEYQRAARAVWARFIYDLPKELQDELELPIEVENYIGLTRRSFSVKIGDRFYDYMAYWKAMTEAVNGREGEVQERDTRHVLKIQFVERQSNGRVIVEFASNDPSECGRISETVSPVLHDSIEERILFMESRRHWFDCPASRATSEIERIAAIGSPEDRSEALSNWREESPEVYYRGLVKIFANSPSFSLSNLALPNWKRLPQHLRISSSTNVDTGLSEAAEALNSQEGFPVALRRMICLPVKLPATLERQWREMTNTETSRLFAELLAQPHSIVADLHLLRLAALRDQPDLWGPAEKVAAHLLDGTKGPADFQLFKALLKLVDSQFNNWFSEQMFPPWMKLACIWYHASRLHGFLRRAPDLRGLTEWVAANTNRWTREILARDTEFWSDIARADNVSYGNLILHGIAHLIGEWPYSGPKLHTTERLAALLEQSGDGPTAYRVELCRRDDFLHNNLGTFQNQATDVEIDASFGLESRAFFARVSDQEIRVRLEELANSPDDPALWAMMHMVIAEGQPPPPISGPLLDLLRTVDFGALARSHIKMLGPALTFACHQARLSNDVELIRRLEDVVMGFAQLATERTNDAETGSPLWMVLSNGLISLAVVPGDEDESVRRFFDFFRRFLELCAPAAGQIGPASVRWTRRLPFAQQTNLWPFIFAVRALS